MLLAEENVGCSYLHYRHVTKKLSGGAKAKVNSN
jgi:hypothetical protein